MKSLMLFVCMIATGVTFDAQAKPFESQVETVTEATVLFNQNKASVSGDGIKKLKTLPAGETEIIGFASSEGTYGHNMSLSERRADFVARLLNRDATVIALGESDANPVVDSKDRKVVIRVTSFDLVYSPIFQVVGTLQGPISHLSYNTIPVR